MKWFSLVFLPFILARSEDSVPSLENYQIVSRVLPHASTLSSGSYISISKPRHIGEIHGSYTPFEMVGAGGFGEVWRGVSLNRLQGIERVVLKRLRRHLFSSIDSGKLSGEREIVFGRITRSLPHCSRFIEFFERDLDVDGSIPLKRDERDVDDENKNTKSSDLWVVFADEGESLFTKFFKFSSNLSLEPTQFWHVVHSSTSGVEVIFVLFLQLSRALHALHNRNIIHRDVKLQNLLLRQALPLDLRLIDFGSAIMRDQHGDPEPEIMRLYETAGPSTAEETSFMHPPEVLVQVESGDLSGWRNLSYDVWTSGFVLLQLLLGRVNALEDIAAFSFDEFIINHENLFKFQTQKIRQTLHAIDRFSHVTLQKMGVDPTGKLGRQLTGLGRLCVGPLSHMGVLINQTFSPSEAAELDEASKSHAQREVGLRVRDPSLPPMEAVALFRSNRTITVEPSTVQEGVDDFTRLVCELVMPVEGTLVVYQGDMSTYVTAADEEQALKEEARSVCQRFFEGDKALVLKGLSLPDRVREVLEKRTLLAVQSNEQCAALENSKSSSVLMLSDNQKQISLTPGTSKESAKMTSTTSTTSSPFLLPSLNEQDSHSLKLFSEKDSSATDIRSSTEGQQEDNDQSSSSSFSSLLLPQGECTEEVFLSLLNIFSVAERQAGDLPGIFHLVSSLLEVDPNKRISFSEVLTHPLLRKARDIEKEQKKRSKK
eukprot:GDKJ01018338.1.p1 GENE.GDKJ01018338.1~~GDKJ01018338.1.p1  ORF type:complete len:713 (+),score=137.34 GDKJ01018338.1:43-2181(+)